MLRHSPFTQQGRHHGTPAACLDENDKEFKELFGVKKETFQQMLDVPTDAREKRRQKGGPRTKLSVGDPLLLTLQCWREYRTMAHIAHDFGVVKSTVSDTITMIENVLIQDERFHWPGKKALVSKENSGRTLAVDVNHYWSPFIVTPTIILGDQSDAEI